jgi:LysR family transcriptional regulator, benzoate and cis,cis-muconate-responsive activator of ben and cat genes
MQKSMKARTFAGGCVRDGWKAKSGKRSPCQFGKRSTSFPRSSNWPKPQPRLSNRDWIDPEELALETIPTLPDNHHLGAWAAIHFPDHTPSGRPIARGPVVTTIRESLAAVESGEAVVIVGARAELYYSNPRIRFIEIGVAPVGTALVRRRADRRRVILDLEECARDVAAGLVDAVEH